MSIVTTTLQRLRGAPSDPIDPVQALHDAIIANKALAVIGSLIHDDTINVKFRGKTALHVAVETGSVEVVELVTRHRPDLSITEIAKGNTCFHAAVIRDSAPILFVLKSIAKAEDMERTNEAGDTPFFMACMEGKANAARALRDMGACMDAIHSKRGQSALHFAAGKGHVDVVRLFENRRDLISVALTKTWVGATPLHAACQGGHVNAARALLEMGASREATYNNEGDSGWTPLHMAAEKGNALATLVELFQDRPDILNAKTACGKSAQRIAAAANGHLFVKELLKYGVEPVISKYVRLKKEDLIVYLEDHPQRVRRALEMTTRGRLSLQEQRHVLGCLDVHRSLNSNSCRFSTSEHTQLKELRVSCDALFDVIYAEQNERIRAAVAIVMGDDRDCKEEQLLGVLETLSFQHQLAASLATLYGKKIAKLNARTVIFFEPLKRMLKMFFSMLEQKGIEQAPDFKVKIDYISQNLQDIANLISILFDHQLCFHHKETTTRFLAVCKAMKESLASK